MRYLKRLRAYIIFCNYLDSVFITLIFFVFPLYKAACMVRLCLDRTLILKILYKSCSPGAGNRDGYI